MHFELEFFIIICFNYKILQLSLRLGFLLGKKINTVERLYNEVLGIMIDFLYLSNSKIYEKKLSITKLHYIIVVNTFCQSLGPLLNRCEQEKLSGEASRARVLLFLKSLPLLFSLAYFSVRSLAPSYSWTSSKQPPKMQRLSDRLWKVAIYKNQTTGGLF